jgi:acyl dehydratase
MYYTSRMNEYVVGREKVREFAAAIGERSPLCHDVAAARAAGYADVVAPPMFVVVYALAAVTRALRDPALGIDFRRVVHGAQAFEWDLPVVAGDMIVTAARIGEVTRKDTLTFHEVLTVSHNGRGEQVSSGTWTNIERG